MIDTVHLFLYLQYLLTCKKPEIQAMCKARGLKCTGTKEDLMKSLLSGAPVDKTPAATSKPKSKVVATPTVIKNITASIPIITIKKNKYGNHEHAETSFVFNGKTKEVIGKQNDNGTVDDLTKDDIDICNQYKFPFILPSNLDKKTRLEEEEVEELDDDDEIIESEVEGEEEADIIEDDLIADDDEIDECSEEGEEEDYDEE